VELADVELALVASASNAARLPALEIEVGNLEAEGLVLATAQQSAAAENATAFAELAALERRAANLVDEVASAMAEYGSVADRVAALKREAARLARLAETIAAVGSARARLTSAVEHAEREAHLAGFDSVDAARAAVLAPAELDELRRNRAEWQAHSSRLGGALAVDDFAGLDAESALAWSESTWLAAADTAAELDQLEAAHADAALAAERAADATDRFGKRRREVELAQNAHAALGIQAAPVVHLARLARGITGNRRVALTTYVLRQWFEQVVLAANARLRGMSSGRYELVRVDEGSTKIERRFSTTTPASNAVRGRCRAVRRSIPRWPWHSVLPMWSAPKRVVWNSTRSSSTKGSAAWTPTLSIR